MNQSDTAQKYSEIKTLIDRTLPLIEHGKGCELKVLIEEKVLHFF